MTQPSENKTSPVWIEAEMRLVGSLDNRMISLLKAIHQSGSINQAAKRVGLSYKGAWQMIERANNLAPKVLISTATGGSKGGGSQLTTAGLALLRLFDRLEQQHSQFLQQLNQSLMDEPDIQLLLKRLVVKTSATNQLFGTINRIKSSSINVEVFIHLKGGELIVASLALAEWQPLGLKEGDDVLLLINAAEILITDNQEPHELSARNQLIGVIIRLQQDGVDSEVVIQLPGGESLVAIITQASAESLRLKLGTPVNAVFKSNAVILGALLRK